MTATATYTKNLTVPEKPIREVRVGDKVLATDPVTGVTSARSVIGVDSASRAAHDGRARSLGRVVDHRDRPAPVLGCLHRGFTDAIHLPVGDQLLTDHGRYLTVTSMHSHVQELKTYNLTIDGIHTYYAGASPVLVHNGCEPGLDAIKIAQHANEEGHVIPGVDPADLDQYVERVMKSTGGAPKIGGGRIVAGSRKRRCRHS